MIKPEELSSQYTDGTNPITCIGVAEIVDPEQLVIPSRQETAAVLRGEQESCRKVPLSPSFTEATLT